MTTNAVTRLQERLAPGSHFVYAGNTFHESTGGGRFIGREMVVKSGKWTFDIDVLGETGGFRMEIPSAARRVEWLDENTVRYAIVQRPDHYVTLRFPAP